MPSNPGTQDYKRDPRSLSPISQCWKYAHNLADFVHQSDSVSKLGFFHHQSFISLTLIILVCSLNVCTHHQFISISSYTSIIFQLVKIIFFFLSGKYTTDVFLKCKHFFHIIFKFLSFIFSFFTNKTDFPAFWLPTQALQICLLNESSSSVFIQSFSIADSL